MPTLVDLAERYGVAVGTAHRAIAVLSAEGVLKRHEASAQWSPRQRPARSRVGKDEPRVYPLRIYAAGASQQRLDVEGRAAAT